MLRAIANALANLWCGALGVVRWTEQLVRWPFNVIFGSGGGSLTNPEYKPDVSSAQLLEEFDEARARQEAVHDLDRDGISTVVRYAKALPSARPTMDLSGLGKDVQATLLTMDDHEIRALANAGIGEIRKFVEGKPHGIFGVPVVRSLVTANDPPKEMTAEERVLWKVRSRMLKAEHSQELKLSR